MCVVERPEEAPGASVNTETAVFQEGSEATSIEYFLPFATELELQRTFTSPGKIYTIVMRAQNLHEEGDVSIFTWKVMCGSPVIAQNWSMTYDPYIR